MPLFTDVYKTLTDDVIGGWKLLKSTIWGTYISCDVNSNISKNDMIDTKSRLVLKFEIDYKENKPIYIYFISKKDMLKGN